MVWTIVQPLHDITQNQINKHKISESFDTNSKIISDQKMQTMKLISNKRTPVKKFNFTTDLHPKLSSRSLANRNRTWKAGKKIDFYSYTHKNVGNSYMPSEKSVDSSVNNYQNSEFNYNYQRQNQKIVNIVTETDLKSDKKDEISVMHQKLNSTEIGYLKWKKWAQKQNEKISIFERQVFELQKELAKTHKRLSKYKQLKEHGDIEYKKLQDYHQKDLLAHAAKMKKVFLKEYEELMNEKHNSYGSSNWNSPSNFNFKISELTGKLSTKNMEIRNLKTQIKGKFFI